MTYIDWGKRFIQAIIYESEASDIKALFYN